MLNISPDLSHAYALKEAKTTLGKWVWYAEKSDYMNSEVAKELLRNGLREFPIFLSIMFLIGSLKVIIIKSKC